MWVFLSREKTHVNTFEDVVNLQRNLSVLNMATSIKVSIHVNKRNCSTKEDLRRYLDFGFFTALFHCLPVKAVRITQNSIYMFRTVSAKASKGKGRAPWAHRQDMGRKNWKHQHWSATHRENHLNCYIYFVEKSDDTTMDFSGQCTQWGDDKQNPCSIAFLWPWSVGIHLLAEAVLYMLPCTEDGMDHSPLN